MSASELAARAKKTSNPDWWHLLYLTAMEAGETHVAAMNYADDAIAEQPEPIQDIQGLAGDLANESMTPEVETENDDDSHD